MLDRFIQSPIAAVGFIVFVVVLFLIYLANRERAQVQRLKGPSRFQPDWSRTGREGRRRRQRRRRPPRGEFRPDWGVSRPGRAEEGQDAADPAGPETPPRGDTAGK